MQNPETQSAFAISQFSTFEGKAIPQSHLLHAGVGGIAGLFMESVLHPVDTVRTRIKVNTSESVSLVHQVKAMHLHEGPHSYFRGFTCTILGGFSVNASYFYVYEKLKHAINQQGILSKDATPFAAAFAGGIFSNLISMPFDVVRTRMQLKPGSYDYKHFWDGATKVLKHEGFKKLYLGGSAFFALTALETSLTFGFYEFFYKVLNPHFPSNFELNLPLTMVCSMSAAGLAGFIVNPLEVIVTRMQSVDTKKEGPCSLIEMTKKIYHNEGLKGFMKGVTGTMYYYGVGALLLIPTYEVLKCVFKIDLSK